VREHDYPIGFVQEAQRQSVPRRELFRPAFRGQRLGKRPPAHWTLDAVSILEQLGVTGILEEFHSVTDRLEIHAAHTHWKHQQALNGSVLPDFLVFTGDNRTPSFL